MAQGKKGSNERTGCLAMVHRASTLWGHVQEKVQLESTEVGNPTEQHSKGPFIRVYHCVNGDGPFDRQIGFCPSM